MHSLFSLFNSSLIRFEMVERKKTLKQHKVDNHKTLNNTEWNLIHVGLLWQMIFQHFCIINNWERLVQKRHIILPSSTKLTQKACLKVKSLYCALAKLFATSMPIYLPIYHMWVLYVIFLFSNTRWIIFCSQVNNWWSLTSLTLIHRGTREFIPFTTMQFLFCNK